MASLRNSLVPSWTPDSAVSKWADRNDFGPAVPMSDGELRKLSSACMGKPTGLYLWEGLNHEIYVGISEASVVARLRSHCREFAAFNIQSFRFRPSGAPAVELRRIEKALVHDALQSGFITLNREYVGAVHGVSVLDKLVPAPDQQTWMADPVRANGQAPRRFHDIDPSEDARSRRTFPDLIRRRDGASVIDAVSVYLRACVPYPFETQVAYWVVSCLPALRLADPNYKRIATLSMGYMEMLWVTQEPSGAHSVHLGVHGERLQGRRMRLKLAKSGAVPTGIRHRNGGPYELVLKFASLESFISVMQSSVEIRMAAARFALDRMRMGKVGRYRESHNYLLADEALRRFDQWKFESGTPGRGVKRRIESWGFRRSSDG